MVARAYRHERFLQLGTTVPLLLVACIAFFLGEQMFGVLLCAVSGISSVYHMIKPFGPDWWWSPHKTAWQYIMLYVDTIGVIVLIGYGSFLFFLKGFPPLFWVALGLLCVLAMQMMMPVKRYYVAQHAFWHVGGALIAFLVIIA